VEQWNIADAVNLKREERNKHSTYLLCTSCGDRYTKMQQHVEDLKRGTLSGIVPFALNSAVISQKNIILQNKQY